jgi:hypothetical protein
MPFETAFQDHTGPAIAKVESQSEVNAELRPRRPIAPKE